MYRFLQLSLLYGLLLSIGFVACKHEPIQPQKQPINTGNNNGGNTGGNNGGGNNGGGNTGGGNGSPNDSIVSHPCDPDTVYFSRQILPLIVSNCSMDGCHSARSHADGVVLTNYQNIRSEVDPYDPWDSELYESLFDDDDLMPPPPRAPFNAAQKALIRTWINQGAKNLTCDEGCDTTAAAFAQDVHPIITTKCTGCHSTTLPLGGVILESYNDIKTSAANGSLLGTILHTSGYNLMPPSGGALPNCEVVKIRKWIDNGMPNN